MPDTGPVTDRRTYVLDEGCPAEAVSAAHRETLLVLRPHLDRVEIDPDSGWPPEVADAVAQLHQIGQAQGRIPPRARTLWMSGVDLTPRDDAHFALLVALCPLTLRGDGCDADTRHLYSTNDIGGLWVRLTDAEYQDLQTRLTNIDERLVLLVRPQRFGLWRRLLRRPTAATSPGRDAGSR